MFAVICSCLADGQGVDLFANFPTQSSEGASSSGRGSSEPAAIACTRRSMQLAMAAAAAVAVVPVLPVKALTLQDVTPKVIPAGALSARLAVKLVLEIRTCSVIKLLHS